MKNLQREQRTGNEGSEGLARSNSLIGTANDLDFVIEVDVQVLKRVKRVNIEYEKR